MFIEELTAIIQLIYGKDAFIRYSNGEYYAYIDEKTQLYDGLSTAFDCLTLLAAKYRTRAREIETAIHMLDIVHGGEMRKG